MNKRTGFRLSIEDDDDDEMYRLRVVLHRRRSEAERAWIERRTNGAVQHVNHVCANRVWIDIHFPIEFPAKGWPYHY